MTGGPDPPHDQAMTGDKGALRTLLSYARPYRAGLVAGGLLTLVAGATGLALPLVVRQLIDDLGHGRPVTGLLLFMSALVVANAGVGAWGGYVLRRVAESVVLTARRRIISHLQRLRVSAVDRIEPGDLMTRVTADTTLLREVTIASLFGAVEGGLTMIATMVMMGLLDLVLLGVTLGVLVLAAVMIGLVVPRINRAARRAQESVGIMGAALERMFGAFRTVKASGAEDREGGRIQDAATVAWQSSVQADKWAAIVGSVAGLAVQLAFLTVMAVGGGRVATGSTDVGTLIAFLLYVYYLIPSIQKLVDAVTEYQIGRAAIVRIRDTETVPVEPDGHHGQLPELHDSPATVAFDKVSFRYRHDLPDVLHGVTFTVPPCGMTAFVGLSGTGKTTVFSLIERFYDADSGRVLLDGKDVKEWPIADLRAAIGYVEQDVPVLSGTLRENIKFGAPQATDSQVQAVLRVARLEDLVARLPEGLDASVGHRGTKLSGGERQRVAIARALLRRPRLLLLDEATSHLDAVNERALHNTITEAARSTTVLVVAHRLATLTNADRIVVLDAGETEAIGTHDELVATDSLYAELAASQFLERPRAEEISHHE